MGKTDLDKSRSTAAYLMIDRMSKNYRPIFIVGSPRSGTTLLRFILCSHPRIYIPEETGFIPFLKTDVNRKLTIDQTEKLIHRIGSLNYLWKDIIVDIDKFYFSLTDPTLRNVLDALYNLIIKPFGAVRWGDKTPLYVRYIPIITSIFPDAQIIHMIRDGRDCTLSAQKKWGATHIYMDNYYLLKNWDINVKAGIESGQSLQHDQYIEIRYEDLVLDQEITIQKICEFIGEDFSNEMLDHTVLAQKVGPGPNQHFEVLKPIHGESIYRWKTKMNSFNLRMSDYILGPTLQKLGYELSNAGTFTNLEWGKIFLLKQKYTLSEGIRRLLYAFNIFTLNRNMRRRVR